MIKREQILSLVSKHPLLFIQFNFDESYSIHASRRGISQFTITQRHEILNELIPLTVCMFSLEEAAGANKLYIGIVQSKRAVSTFDSVIKITDGIQLYPDSLEALAEMIMDQRLKKLFQERIKEKITVGSPKLSETIISCLLSIEKNQSTLESIVQKMDGFNSLPQTAQMQMNAIQLAMAAFGISKFELPSVTLL